MTKQYQRYDLVLFERILDGMIAGLEGTVWAIREDRLPAKDEYECEQAITHLYNAKESIKDELLKQEGKD